MKKTWFLAVAGAASLSLAACAADDGDDLEPEDMDPIGDEDGKFEAWNSANNPSYVDSTFILYAHQLPLEGTGQTPIPGDYWATAADNLNVKWDGSTSLSPAGKWGKAFNKPTTENNISLYHGVKSSTWRKACATDSDCSDQMDGSICAKSFDNAEKRCIPTWWGICHGWAPYALREPAARNPVTKTASDGTQVTFYPGDLEGYMSLIYTDVPTKFISSRCNKDMPPTDAAGRLVNGECRDMNPGAWHVITTNLMGLRKQGFVLDQTYDDEVWNQPGWKFNITNKTSDGKLEEISKSEAISLLGLGQSLTALLASTEVKKDVTKSGEFTATAAGEHTVKLSGTGDADLYTRRGAAPTLDTYDCRPYGGTSVEECKVNLAAGEKVYWMVNGYSTTSTVAVGVAAPASGAATYEYNTSAKKFFHVEMDFTFIVEGRPERETKIDDAASYSTTKHYSYILEADEYNKILGGEWLGSSRSEHPDFAWWPTATPTDSQAGGLMSYAEIKALNDESAGGPTVSPNRIVAIDNYTINTSGEWKSKYAAVQVPAGTDTMTITMTGTGDANLYVRKGQNPTIYVYNCKSVTSGTSAESCTIDPPSTGGTYYVRARAKTTSKVTVTVDLQ